MFQLRDYQQKGVSDIRNAYVRGYRAPLYVLPTGGGKCLAHGTEVLMFNGTVKQVQDVLPGDWLIGPDSKPRRVLSTCKGREMLYRVVPVKGDPYTVNESHILSLKITDTGKGDSTVCGGSAYKAGDVANVSVLDFLSASKTFKHRAKGWRSAADFLPNEKALPLDPYFFGLWLGDGNSTKPCFTSGDPVVFDYLTRVADQMGMQVRVEPNSENSFNYHLIETERPGRRGNQITNLLKSLGVINNKHVPIEYKRATVAERLDLLAGIIDTDGSYTGKGFDICLKNERLLDDVIFVARSLGLAAYKSPCQKKCHNTGAKGEYFRANISGDIDRIPVRIERKKAAPRRQKKDVLVTGVNIEPIGEGDYYGFEIDGDHLFLLGDFTVTHNTVVFAHIGMTMATAPTPKKCLILVHRVELLRQTAAKLRGLGVRTGLISPKYTPDFSANVQVAMVQTIVNRLHLYPYFDLIVTDEAHHSVAGNYVKVQRAYPQAFQLGVTATPIRGDGLGLGINAGGPFDCLILGPTVKQLIQWGFLAQPIMYAPEQKLDLTGVRTTLGDYNRNDLVSVIDKPSITGNAVEYYRSYSHQMPGVAFCVSVAHAEHVAADFRAAGYKFYSVDGSMDDDKRERIFTALGDGSIHGVTSCDLISEGTDIPAIYSAFLLRPTQSTGLYLQQVGRALRVIPGKDKALIFDHVGNFREHGFPEDDRAWDLDGEKRTKKKKGQKDAAPAAIWCKNCFAVHSPSLLVCPQCGTVRPIVGRQIDTVEGQLVELSDYEKEQIRRKQRQEVGKADSLSALEMIAKKRGYKPGWADHVWKAKQEKEAAKKAGQKVTN